MVLDIPSDLKLDIIRRVARDRFLGLRPFIAAGNETKNLVFTREVLEETGLDEFMVFGSMAREASIYRPFLLKCVQAGNVQAKYIEGVRLLREHGENQHGFQLLSEASELFINAKFALGIFLLCAVAFEEVMGTVLEMWDIVQNLDCGVQIADFVVQQIASMGIEPKGVFKKTLQYRGFRGVYIRRAHQMMFAKTALHIGMHKFSVLCVKRWGGEGHHDFG